MTRHLTPSDVEQYDLPFLIGRGIEDIGRLPPQLQAQWATETTKAGERARTNRVDALIQEFNAPFRENILPLTYELAFLPHWYDDSATQPLYNTRWWINAYTAGVYFIYDDQSQLEYVGRSCGGQLGQRLWAGHHKPYRHVVDVVLFDKHHCHFALAFEALAVSRLTPLTPLLNDEFVNLRIPPPPYFMPPQS